MKNCLQSLLLYKAEDFEEATDMAYHLVILGGAGHTSVLYTDARTQERINYFAKNFLQEDF